jgi:quercetin dioxygenase-like cupin family protein
MAHRTRLTVAGDGTRLHTVDSTATEKVGADDTDGSYELFEVDAPRGSGIPPHRHPWAEAYYVLDGTLDVVIGARTLPLGPGDTVTVPPNAAHTFAVTSERCRFLAFSLGGAMGELFADLDANVPEGPLEVLGPRIAEVAAAHGVSFLGAPVPA